jgi:hypothetical protein
VFRVVAGRTDEERMTVVEVHHGVEQPFRPVESRQCSNVESMHYCVSWGFCADKNRVVFERGGSIAYNLVEFGDVAERVLQFV